MRRSWLILRYLGWRWALFRLWHNWRLKTGALRRATPASGWMNVELPSHARETAPAAAGLFNRQAPGGAFAAALRNLDERFIAGSAPRKCVAAADGILRGGFVLYAAHRRQAGFPPDWLVNLFTGERAPADCHWSELGDFGFGDIKNIWELSRFGWAFTLARAYARTGDDRFAAGFWQLLEDWMAANPPNLGPNWKCGQETTFRLMAASFARFVCAPSPESTPERVRRWELLVAASGRRIEANIAYALSQSNNHGVSECVGLITAALVCPWLPESGRWLRRGQCLLRRQAGELVYADGAFSQHSVNYHRVLLHDLIWAVQWLRAGGIEPDGLVLEQARRALAFIDQLVDPVSGGAPVLGANDGSLILPLSECGYEDFRPLLQLGYAVLHRQRRLPPGPWDEPALWLAQGEDFPCVPDGARAPVWDAPAGGCQALRAGESWLMLHGVRRFRHRPSQADLLHVDVWWRGRNVACDAGSYSYNAPGRFTGGFGRTQLHNTVEVDGRDQLCRAGRFLYLPWPRGNVRVDGPARCITASHEGYRGIGVSHEREIAGVGDQGFRVTDRLRGRGRHRYRLHWLLADGRWEWDEAAHRLILRYPEGDFIVTWACSTGDAVATLIRADVGSSRGWRSRHYQQAEPALSLAVEAETGDEAVFTTTLAPQA